MNDILPKRPNYRLKGFDYSQIGLYFITIVSYERKNLFSKLVTRSDVGDGVLDVPKIQLSKYGLIIEKYIHSINNIYKDVNIIKYCIMPNHIHFIVEITTSGMSETPLTGTSRTPLTGTSRTPLTGTSETPLTGTSRTPLTGTSRTPLTGTSRTPLTGTSETPLTGTSRTPSPTTNSRIPKLISTLKRFVNKEIGFNVWQRSYYDHIIRDSKDYNNIWNYIDTNPIRWQIKKFNKSNGIVGDGVLDVPK